MLSDRWKHTVLGDHIDLLTGHPFTSADYSSRDEGIRLLRGDNVVQGTIRWTDAKLWPAEKTRNHERFRLKVGDIVVALDRTWVKAGLKAARIRQHDLPCLLVQRVARLRAQSTLNQDFLDAIIQSHRFVEMVKSSKTETAVPHISPGDIRDFIFDLPPLPEQQKIAEILGAWETAIAAVSRLIAAKRRRFTWFRTHLFTGVVRLGSFDVDWVAAPLHAVLHEHGLNSTGMEEVFSVSVHKGLVNQIEHLGRSFAAADTRKYNRVKPGDIIYTKSPTGDFPLGIIKRSQVDQDVIVSPLYGVFTPETDDLGVILDAYFESPILTGNYLRPLVQKGAKNTIAITNKRFLEGYLRLPRDPDEQKAIADVVRPAREELDALHRQRAALKRQKRGLMQKLLTGEWRVPGVPVG